MGDRPPLKFADQTGSVIATTSSSGGLLNINRYDAYGQKNSSNLTYASRFAYTGQAYINELGMYYYKARMYNQMLGRFLQTDPIGYEDGMNWYAYVGNDPVNMVDPFGLAETGGNCGQGDDDRNCGEIIVTATEDGNQTSRGDFNISSYSGEAAQRYVSAWQNANHTGNPDNWARHGWEPSRSDAIAGAMGMAISRGDAANQSLNVIGFQLEVVLAGGGVINALKIPAVREMAVELGAEMLANFVLGMPTDAYTDKYSTEGSTNSTYSGQQTKKPKPRFRTRWSRSRAFNYLPFRW